MGLFHADRKFERFEDVTPEILEREGVKLLLCDLDNTLRLHGETEPSEELAAWIRDVRGADVKVVVISNNGRKKMMQKFCKPIGIPCVWWSKKPISTKLTAAMDKYKFRPDETAMLGDRVMTDVLAAKFAGVKAWKVEPRKDVI